MAQSGSKAIKYTLLFHVFGMFVLIIRCDISKVTYYRLCRLIKRKSKLILNPDSHLFLSLNASVVWFVVAAVLMKLCRLKSLVLVLIIAPFVIGSTFRNVAGMPQLIGFYGTSILYGAVGIVGGILYVEYAKAKAYFHRASKTSFLARGMIALSSLYLLSFFAQKIIVQNPMVEFALSWIDGGEQATELLSIADFEGAYTAGACILGGFGVLAINKYRESRQAAKGNDVQDYLEHQ